MLRKLFANLIYGLFYYSGIWLLFRFFNRHKTAILMYHGITEKELYLWTQLPVSTFRKQMEYLNRRYNAISLSNAVANLGRKAPPINYSIVVTFDDGFSSNDTLGRPILTQYNIPATIFLATSFINRETRFGGLIWTDFIFELFRNTARNYFDFRDIGLWEMDISTPRKRVEDGSRVCKAIKEMPAVRGKEIIDWIAARLGTEFQEEDLRIFKNMNWDEIRTLSCGGIISFGAHTVNHEILTKIPNDDMVREIRDSKSEIERQIGIPVNHFAYPNGGNEDFSPEIRNTVEKYFECALTTLVGLNSPGDDLYQLKRLGIGNDMKLWKFKLGISGVVEFVCDIQGLFGKAFGFIETLNPRKGSRTQTAKL